MLKNEQILKILKKYGFYSLNRAPYLYCKEDKWGVCFSWPNLHYGNLERVLFFNDELALEEEVFKYWWYLNNKNKYSIVVEFDDYEILNPKVFYRYKNAILTMDLMKNFEKEKGLIVDEGVLLKKKQFFRTAEILISILKEKFRIQNETYFEVLGLYKTLKALNKEYEKKINEYNKSKTEVFDGCETLDDYDGSENFSEVLLHKLSSLETFEEINSFIGELLLYLKDLDLSEVNLHNLYLLNYYPFQIEDMKKKIDILDQSIKNKKKIFNAKQNILEEINKVDKESNCKQLLDINLYVKNERKLILEKYDNCENIERDFLGDYFINVDNLKINIPDVLESGEDCTSFEREELLKDLQLKYDRLSKIEKDASHIATSFLSECLNYLINIKGFDQMSTKEIIEQLTKDKSINCFNEAFKLLDNYLNTKYRVKYMSILKVTSFENFIESLKETINILGEIDIKLDYGFIGYNKTLEAGVIVLNLKNFSHLNQNISYIFQVKPSISIYYSPIQIVRSLDIVNYEEFVVKDKPTIFLIKDRVAFQSKKQPKSVIRYEKNKFIQNDDFTIITDMKEMNKCIYYENFVSLKEK